MVNEKRTIAESPIFEFMREMGPKMGPPEACEVEGPTLDGAVMCSIMVLNSALERQGNRMMEEHGLTLPQWLALGSVASGGKDGVPHSHIGNQLMLSKAPVTGVVDRLERAGFVERHPDKQDRRVSRVVITSEGLEMWWRVKKSLRTFSVGLFEGHLNEEEQEQLLHLLGKFLEAVSARDAQIPGLKENRVASRMDGEKL